MHRLVQGFKYFNRHVYPKQHQLFRELATRQTPHTMMITCSDSRIVPERIFSTEPGDLFVYRNAGNIVPPYTQQVSGEVAAIEYAVDALKVQHIVICGHSDCGAMKAVLQPELVKNMSSVAAWLKHADRARHVVTPHTHSAHGHSALQCLTEENVIAQLDHLRTLPVVAAGLARRTLQIHGWVYDIADAMLRIHDPQLGAFTTLDMTAESALETELKSPARWNPALQRVKG